MKFRFKAIIVILIEVTITIFIFGEGQSFALSDKSQNKLTFDECRFFVVKGYDIKTGKVCDYLITEGEILNKYYTLIEKRKVKLPFETSWSLFRNFLKSVVNGRIILSENEPYSTFMFGKIEKDEELFDEYTSKGIKFIIKKYFKTKGHKKIIINDKGRQLNVRKRKYLIFLLVKNGYKVIYNEYDWSIIVIKK